MELAVASYNIHGCVGRDGHFDPERIADVLTGLEVQAIALQEVESNSGQGLDVLNYLSDRTGMFHVSGPTLLRENGHYGNALLLASEAQEVDRIDISMPGFEPRGIIDTGFIWHDQYIRVLATHLGLDPRERRNQVKQHILPLVERIHEDDFMLLMGDLNEWLLWGRPLRWLKRYFTGSRARRTYPSGLPLFALDRIWVHPHYCRVNTRTVLNKLTRVASDHLPLRAVIEYHSTDREQNSEKY